MKYKEIWKTYNKVFDIRTFKILEYLRKSGYIKDELIPVSEGKEAIVFKSGDFAIKIYKVMNISYREQYKYLAMDPRFKDFPRTIIGIIYTWVKKEYINLNRMYKNLVPVPMPIFYKGNILVMEWIGDEKPAPTLHEMKEIRESEKLFKKILDAYKKIYNSAKLVHGDFSEYNILIYKDNPYIIDVSQAIPSTAPAAETLLERDIKNIVLIAKKLGLEIIYEVILKEIKSDSEG